MRFYMKSSKDSKVYGKVEGIIRMDDYECITADSVLSRPDPFWPVLKPKATDVPIPDITVRKATISDLEDCLRLILAMEKESGTEVTDIEDARLGVAKSLVWETFYFLALIDGAVVGQLQVTPECGWDDKQSWLISDIYVQPESRRKGVALALLKAVRADAVRYKTTKFKGWVKDTNEAAKALYEKLEAKPTLRLYEWEEPGQLDTTPTPRDTVGHNPPHIPVTLSQKLSRRINHHDLAAGLTRNGYPVSAEEVQRWDREGQVPEDALSIFALGLDLSEPEEARVNQIPVKDKGDGFVELHKSFYQDGWFVYLWDDAIGVYKTDKIERSEEGAKHQLGPQ
jgi:ribosomal protein S18 acetylase RimI-like enzyme